jgi:hypothetical protein
MLTQTELKRILNYNPSTGIFTRLVAAGPVKAGATANFHDARGYIIIRIANKDYKSHRLAWFYMMGYWPKQEIDHINGVKNDNRWENLRDVNRTVNCQNLRNPKANNKSGYLGVYWSKQNKKWRVRIEVNYKKIHFGYFDNVHEAAERYLSKKRELHEGCTI